MENLENQSSSTFWSYSCFWPTIIVELGILIKYCGSDFETDISFLSWLLSKLSESPIFWPWVEENRNLSGRHSNPTQLSGERSGLTPQTDWLKVTKEGIELTSSALWKKMRFGSEPSGPRVLGASRKIYFTLINKLYVYLYHILWRVISRKIES